MATRNPKPRRGRPPAGEDGRTIARIVKVSPSEDERIVAAAKSEGLSVSAWLRDAAEIKLARGSTR